MRTLFLECSAGPLSYYLGARLDDFAVPALSMSSPSPLPARRKTRRSVSCSSELSSREAEVMLMFSRGLSYKEAASAMAISVNTINDHVKSIYRKLGVNSRSEAIFEAVQLGVISL